jgi:hypothetical protein
MSHDVPAATVAVPLLDRSCPVDVGKAEGPAMAVGTRGRVKYETPAAFSAAEVAGPT